MCNTAQTEKSHTGDDLRKPRNPNNEAFTGVNCFLLHRCLLRNFDTSHMIGIGFCCPTPREPPIARDAFYSPHVVVVLSFFPPSSKPHRSHDLHTIRCLFSLCHHAKIECICIHAGQVVWAPCEIRTQHTYHAPSAKTPRILTLARARPTKNQAQIERFASFLPFDSLLQGFASGPCLTCLS